MLIRVCWLLSLLTVRKWVATARNVRANEQVASFGEQVAQDGPAGSVHTFLALCQPEHSTCRSRYKRPNNAPQPPLGTDHGIEDHA